MITVRYNRIATWKEMANQKGLLFDVFLRDVAATYVGARAILNDVEILKDVHLQPEDPRKPLIGEYLSFFK